MIIKLFLVLLPWSIRRYFLCRLYGYKIHKTARIGYSYIYPENLIMHEFSVISSLCVAVHLDELSCGAHSFIGRQTWITGHPANGSHFKYKADRRSVMLLGSHASIAKNHLFDCTDQISIGDYSTIAGYSSQFLTHGINIENNRQECSPISIGSFCLIGSSVIFLGGAVLPGNCLVGAGSLVKGDLGISYALYAGCPAIYKKALASDADYFLRKNGFVN